MTVEQAREERRKCHEEMVERISNIESDIKIMDSKVRNLDELTKTIKDQTLAINELAINMKNQLEELKSHGKRLSVLETQPSKRWNLVIDTLIAAIVGGIVGIIIAYVK